MPQLFTNKFKRTYWVIGRQVDGLTNADSLRQLPFRGNCLNWVVGHILESRNSLLKLLGGPEVMLPEQTSLYGRGSEPITSAQQAVPLDRLLARLAASQDAILACLDSMGPDALDAVVDAEQGTTLFDRVDFYHWHETYHTGQLEILRQLAGTDDSIID